MLQPSHIAVTAALLLALSAAHAQSRPINDTGQDWGVDSTDHTSNLGEGSIAECGTSTPFVQDCHYGRDAAAAAGVLPAKIGGSSPNSGRSNGFDYTKISNAGTPLPASATLGGGANDWACTRDNVTGLIWEIKVDDYGHLRHLHNTYTWYNTDATTNGGGSGTLGNLASCINSLGGQYCNTQNYVAAINAAGLCGAADWRMPTLKELDSIVDLGRTGSAIDPNYFPNTATVDGPYTESYPVTWSASPYAANPAEAWVVEFFYGTPYFKGRSDAYRVRLVRNAP